jgi:carboxyl-terminal processing protease
MKKLFLENKVLSILIIILCLTWAATGLKVTDLAAAGNRDIYKNLKLFNEALTLIEKNYVEEIDPKTVIEGAIKGMTKSLDPHSAFMTADMYKELQVDTKGVFGGLGIEITIQNDILTVVSPLEDTPAYKVGIKAQDQIIAIDGKSTKGFTIFDAVHKLRGARGSEVTITVIRKGLTKPKDYTIVRDIIKIVSVKHKMVEDNIGYIRVVQFQEGTDNEIKKALKIIMSQGQPLKGLILDMRNNPGGLMDQAVKVSDIFLKSGVVVSTKGRIRTADNVYSAHDDGNEPTDPVIVLINGGSASASEIVAGALHDNGRAILLGTQTFGKGSVQVVIPLDDGSALKLTTAKYYTPGGNDIQAKGITPDIEVEYVQQNNNNNKSDSAIISEKDLQGHLKGEQEDVREQKEESPHTQYDSQLQHAIDLLKSWRIFKTMAG